MKKNFFALFEGKKNQMEYCFFSLMSTMVKERRESRKDVERDREEEEEKKTAREKRNFFFEVDDVFDVYSSSTKEM